MNKGCASYCYLIPVFSLVALFLVSVSHATPPSQDDFVTMCAENNVEGFASSFSDQTELKQWAATSHSDNTVPLYWAAATVCKSAADAESVCSSGIIRTLLEAGVDIERAKDDKPIPDHLKGLVKPVLDGETALMVAARAGCTETVSLLLEAGADITRERGTDGWTALVFAASQGHTRIVRMLLEAGDQRGYSNRNAEEQAVRLAVEQGHITTLFLLLSHNPSLIDTKATYDKGTLLHASLLSPNDVPVTLLLQAGVNPAIKDRMGKYPLSFMRASKTLQAASCQEVISTVFPDRGERHEVYAFRESCEDRYGETPLHHAIRYGRNQDVVVYLEQHPKWREQRRLDGCTPLHLAVLHDNAVALAWLLTFDIDLSPGLPFRRHASRYDEAQCQYQQTPLQWARQLGYQHLVDILAPQVVTRHQNKRLYVSEVWAPDRSGQLRIIKPADRQYARQHAEQSKKPFSLLSLAANTCIRESRRDGFRQTFVSGRIVSPVMVKGIFGASRDDQTVFQSDQKTGAELPGSTVGRKLTHLKTRWHLKKENFKQRVGSVTHFRF
ncbi:ankyrin repeat domain-containing protein [Spongorhabdus nitratireducens]